MVLCVLSRDRQLYLLWLVVIFISRDCYWFGTSGIKLLEIVRDIFILCLPVFLLLKYGVQFPKSILILSAICFALIVVTSVLHQNLLGAPLVIICSMFSAMVISSKISLSNILNSFSNVIIVIAIYSFFIWIIISTHVVAPSLLFNSIGTPINTFGGCLFFYESSFTVYRNSSFFREPGVYMVFLNFALLVEVFFKEKMDIIRIGVLILSLISTFSTGGLITGALIIISYGVSKRANRSVIFILLLILGGAGFFISDVDIFTMIFGKFDTIDSYGSGFARLSSVIIPFEIVKNNPFFGCGYIDFPILYEKIGWQIFHRYVDSKGLATNTVLNLSAIWGMWMGVLVLFGLYKFSYKLSKGKVCIAITLVIIIFLMLCNESLPYNFTLFLFIYYGINNASTYVE